MLISREFKFCYPHAPKTGGSSITKALLPFIDLPRNNYSLESILTAASLSQHGWQTRAHAKGRMHSVLKDNPPAGWVVVAVVRNVWDRATSLANAYSGGDLRALVEGRVSRRPQFCRPQTTWIAGAGKAEVCEIRHEHIAEDFFMFCKDRGIPFEGEFPHCLQRPNKPPWRSLYEGYEGKWARNAVANVYRSDIERFKQRFA